MNLDKCRADNARKAARDADFEVFFHQYVETALWSSTDNSDPETGGDPLDYNFDNDDVAPDSLASMREDCLAFFTDHYELISEDPGQAGHDFWLTRNGHGAGFWDGDWGKHGDELSRNAKVYGACYLLVGDDGMVHLG